MTANDTHAREEVFGLIEQFELRTIDELTDALLDDFARLAGLLGYVKADHEEWGLQSIRDGEVVLTRPTRDQAERLRVKDAEVLVGRAIGPWVPEVSG